VIVRLKSDFYECDHIHVHVKKLKDKTWKVKITITSWDNLETMNFEVVTRDKCKKDDIKEKLMEYIHETTQIYPIIDLYNLTSSLSRNEMFAEINGIEISNSD